MADAVPAGEVPEVWQCEACGEEFDRYQLGHSRAAHARDCDGTCRNCPVEEQCGPITLREALR